MNPFFNIYSNVAAQGGSVVTPSGGDALSLEGDMQGGSDALLLEGDMQDGTDVLELEGDMQDG